MIKERLEQPTEQLRSLEPEKIRGFQFLEPVRLNISMYSISSKEAAFLLKNLFDPHFLDPYNRWQRTRKVLNPRYVKNLKSGFEGHLVGLSKKEILERLKKYEETIQHSAELCGLQLQLNNFIRNPNSLISVKFARQMLITFEALLAEARAERSNLQWSGKKENIEFQEKVYNDSRTSKPIILPQFSFDQATGYLAISIKEVSQSNKIPSYPNDTENQFPCLNEIGRFGFPPLKLVLSKITDSNLY